MEGFFLDISGRRYDADTLRSISMPDEVAQSLQLAACFRFCQAWLNGQQTFELHTSGSTGTPKRIECRRSQLEASAQAAGLFLGYENGQRSLLCLNAAFVGGIMVLARALVWGMGVTVQEPSSQAVPQLPADHPYDHLSLSPIQLQAALSTPGGRVRLERFRTVLIGGADLDAALRTAASHMRGPRLYQTFGMTETLSHLALRHLNAPEPQLWYCTLPGVQIGQTAGQELVVDWPGVTPGLIATHDVIEVLSPDRFVWLGRSDFIINSGGIKIQPEPIEAEAKAILTDILGQSPELILAPVPDPSLGERASLVLEMEEMPELLHRRLKERLESVLPRYHAPRSYYCLKAFPRTPTCKPDRRAIAKALYAQIGLDPA